MAYQKEQYEEYLQSPHWHAVRDRALAYAEHKCQLCYSAKDLQVHHRTYERVGKERPSDLTVLCKACHEKHHDRHHKGRVAMSFDPRAKAHREALFAKIAEFEEQEQ